MSPKQEARIQYWQRTLEHFVSSGLSQTEYTSQYKISKASLKRWSKRVGISLRPFSAKQESSMSFIEVGSYLDQLPLKLELVGVSGHMIKAEITVGLDQVAKLLKSLTL